MIRLVKMLRKIHLYLGCIFAPMILFFSISGLWQAFGLQWTKSGSGPTVLAYLSTIHTGRELKKSDFNTLSSPLMHWFVVVMTICLIATIILGIVMAYKFGHRRAATLSLAAGVALPILFVGLAMLK